MIFLSAQPDDFYFSWQLELQIYNFSQLGIASKDIHILIGYNPQRGLADHFTELITKYSNKASFFIYPDSRRSRSYPSSIRPHLIQQHLLNYPYLQAEIIFYHDSDMIFTELPAFDLLLCNDNWYVSDTRDYLDSRYIARMGDKSLFKDMCGIVGIDPAIVIENDPNCGGAQYLLKKTNVLFWEKIESDSEKLYDLIDAYNRRMADLLFAQDGTKRSGYIGIQAWCADMWALYWNALLLGERVLIHKELGFMVAKSPVEELNTHKILHYSGDNVSSLGPIFKKTKYFDYPPYYDTTLNSVSRQTVSCFLVDFIKEFRKELDKERADLSDVTFLIPIRVDSASRLENLYIITRYLDKYFQTNILIGETDKESRIDKQRLPENCSILFIEDDSVLMHRTRVNNILIKHARTNILAIYDTDVVFPISQIIESVGEIRSRKYDMISPYDGEFVAVSNMFKSVFSNILDPDLLVYHKDAFIATSHRSYGGAIFFDRPSYVRAGMENESFTSWGPEDVERIKRMKNLGFKVKRQEGCLFHLPHERKENSNYFDKRTYLNFMEEYLKVANMSEMQLREYIYSWSWSTNWEVTQLS